MVKKHLIISGTGRAGTTFLVQLFTALGLDTGFEDISAGVFPNCNGGLELAFPDPDAPYIIKSPMFCEYLDQILEDREIIIEHAIVPIRDLFSAAQSRRDVNSRTNPADFPNRGIPGGLHLTDTPEQQEMVLTSQLYKLIYTLAKRDIPMTLLHFPRFIHDPEYLYRKISFAIKGVTYESFRAAFSRVAQPQLIHDFTSKTTIPV